jgi:hypothetical protein
MLDVDVQTKKCSTCQEVQDIARFGKDKSRKDGLNAQCKTCHCKTSKKWEQDNPDKVAAKNKKWQETNSEKFAASVKKYKEANSDKVAAQRKKWEQDNPDKCAAQRKKWQQANPDRVQSINAKRRAVKLHAYPSYANKDLITVIRRQTIALTKLTGIKFQTDHIDPLQGALVCGFEHEDNLQPLTARENARKGNKFKPYGYDFTTNTMYELPKVKYRLVECEEYGYFL